MIAYRKFHYKSSNMLQKYIYILGKKIEKSNKKKWREKFLKRKRKKEKKREKKRKNDER